MPISILLVGSGAREHAIAKAVSRSHTPHALFCFGTSRNPGIMQLARGYTVGDITNSDEINKYAKENTCTFAIIGPEAPLKSGISDALQKMGVQVIGPTKTLAQIETSKGFARDLLSKYRCPGLPRYKRFESSEGLKEYIDSLSCEYVVKADGLMGGKGVKVFGEHLHSWADTQKYCDWLIQNHSPFVIEEKFVGQEFSLMSFSDGTHLAHMPAVQDYKRAYEGDTGPNTGGMGCISDADHSLPFLTPLDIQEAKNINEITIRALRQEFGVGYCGILYGGFMATKDGVKLIEYNARFGDPESIAILSLLQTDLIDIFQAMIEGNLQDLSLVFEQKATVCKYLVPEGYPDTPIKGQEIDISLVPQETETYFGAVDQSDGRLIETGSRTIAVLAKADTIQKACTHAEDGIQHIKGPLFHRKDIGTEELLKKRIDMMREIRSKKQI